MTNKTLLENGIRVVTQRIPHARTVSMGVWVDVGARDESIAENGICHFIEHMIFKGTARRSAYQIAREFDAIGGHTNAFTSMETTCYHAKVMDTRTETMTDILGDILLNSAFDPEEVEKERPVILQEIGMTEDSPEDYLHILSERTYWGEHPLGRSVLGSRKNVAAMEARTIKDFFTRFYHPERIVIAAAGNLAHQHIVDLLAPVFSAIPNGAMPPERRPAEGHSLVSAHERDIEQLHLCFEAGGVSITDPRRFAFSLLNTILGGNMSSRLFQEIRERKGLAYSVYSFMSTYIDSGLFGVYTAVDPAGAEETVRCVLTELNRVRNAPVDAEELENAKQYTRGCLYLSADSVDSQMVRLAQNELHFNTHFTIEAIADRIDAVSAEEVRALARELFRPEALALTLLGPVDDAAPFEKLLAG